jgi:hypothetical protein
MWLDIDILVARRIFLPGYYRAGTIAWRKGENLSCDAVAAAPRDAYACSVDYVADLQHPELAWISLRYLAYDPALGQWRAIAQDLGVTWDHGAWWFRDGGQRCKRLCLPPNSPCFASAERWGVRFKDPDRLQRPAKRPRVPRRNATTDERRKPVSEPAPTAASPGSMTAPPSPSYEREPMPPMRSPAETPPPVLIARSVRTLLDKLARAKQALFGDGRAAPKPREQRGNHTAQASGRPVPQSKAGVRMHLGNEAVGRWWDRLVVSPLRALARPFVALRALLARWKTSENASRRTPSN